MATLGPAAGILLKDQATANRQLKLTREVHQYMLRHHITDVYASLLGALIVRMPDEPLPFLLLALRDLHAQRGGERPSEKSSERKSDSAKRHSFDALFRTSSFDPDAPLPPPNPSAAAGDAHKVLLDGRLLEVRREFVERFITGLHPSLGPPPADADAQPRILRLPSVHSELTSSWTFLTSP